MLGAWKVGVAFERFYPVGVVSPYEIPGAPPVARKPAVNHP